MFYNGAISVGKPSGFADKTKETETTNTNKALGEKSANSHAAAPPTLPTESQIRAEMAGATNTLGAVAENAQRPLPASIPQIGEPTQKLPPAEPVQSVPTPVATQTVPAVQKTLDDERRGASQEQNRAMGYVVSCDGARVVIQTVSDHVTENDASQWAIGRLISINMGKSRIVGLIYELETSNRTWNADNHNSITVRAELQGEVFDGTDQSGPVFRKGISNYPHAGAVAHRIRVSDLKVIYEKNENSCASVGNLSQDASVSAMINIDELISKHFAILGSTGCGKSSATSLILHRIQENSPNLRILILDPHNEYSRGFRDTAATIDVDSLELPHWLFQLDEFAEVLFRGNPAIIEERDALRELIPVAKTLYSQNQEGVTLRKVNRSSNITADSPVPYRISDLLSVIDEQIGLLDSTMDRSVLKSLKSRIESLTNDSRFRFMFSSRMITDNAAETLGKIFRIPASGKPVSIFHMADIPSEVVSSLVSVICRLAFDLTLASAGKLKVLVVCEEAHRYIPSDAGLGFGPTRQSIARIAKEGRKYGTYLCIISQRPGELDPTILSQCNTVFALRLSNEIDQDIVRKAISASSASTVSFLSSIGNREAIAFGEGLSTPMRLRFSDLPNEWLLGYDEDRDPNKVITDLEMNDVLVQWKRANQR